MRMPLLTYGERDQNISGNKFLGNIVASSETDLSKLDPECVSDNEL